MARLKRKSIEQKNKDRKFKRRSERMAKDLEMELDMVCEEDALSPAQLAAFAKAKKEYETSQAKIAEARRNGWIVSESTRKVVNVPSDDDDDVIVLDESVRTSYSGRPRRKASVNVSEIARSLAGGKRTTVRIAPMPTLTITDVRGSVANWPSDVQMVQSQQTSPPAPAPTPPGSLILAHQVGTNQRVLIPQEHFQKLLPGQFTFIKNVNTKPASALPYPIKSILPAQMQSSKRRSVDSGSDGIPSKKKSRVWDTQPPIEGGKWIPLDEYYYGRQEGDPMYREEKGKFSFKCWYCHKMLYNNVRLISHMQGHLESEKQQNLDLADLTQCKHCHRQFDTPFEMQCHIERVHQSNSDTLLCRICEKDLSTLSGLRQHMRMVHVACEMPYICHLCNFRSSIHSDVVDHFKKRHDSSQNTLCYYCLKVFKIHFTKGGDGWGQTQYFYKHLQMHQIKMRSKKCSQCKLMFIQSHSEEAKIHRRRDHLPNYKGIDIIEYGVTRKTLGEKNELAMVQVVDPHAPSSAMKSVNAPTMAKIQDMRGIRLSKIPDVICKECNSAMNTWDHFRKHMDCNLCYFSTTCHASFSLHMSAYHAGRTELRRSLYNGERKVDSPLHCLCGFKSHYGNAMAMHLVSCSKMTAYFNIPEAKFFEYDDEQEDFNPFEPYVEEPESPEADSNVPTMFTALGLVKRSVKSANGSSGSRDDASESKDVSSESKEVSSESKKVALESKKVAFESKDVASESKDVSSESKYVTSERKDVSLESKDVSFESKDVSSESKDVASESKEVALASKDVSSESKDVASESKEVASESKEVAPVESKEEPLEPTPAEENKGGEISNKTKQGQEKVNTESEEESEKDNDESGMKITEPKVTDTD